MDHSTAILERFRALYPREIDLSLDRMRVLLAKLGHPEERLPPVIHVAGTNGKGSTVAFMRAMLEAAGKTVHVYTSPHLVQFHERIRLAGRYVDEAALVDALIAAERANGGAPIPQFEITTAAALLLFAATPADYTLLEVGLGGRYDATNVVDRPLVAAITSISMDHEKFLGDSLAGIAAEKAGIIKRGRPVVVAPQTPVVADVIEEEAERVGAPILAANRDWVARGERGRLVFEDAEGLLDLPAPRLRGRHQYVNAGTAIAALRSAGIPVEVAALEKGLLSVDWPARLQRLTAGALLARVQPAAELWVDGGHNPGAGIVIAEAMADFEDRSSRPLILVAGMLNTKDPVGFFAPFAGLASRVLTVPVPGTDASRTPDDLAEAARSAGLAAEPTGDFLAALDLIRERTEGPPPRILIVGSLYLAGAVLAANGTPPA
jgi:dihydrofolate synthase/folylpolyglutamate synthase